MERWACAMRPTRCSAVRELTRGFPKALVALFTNLKTDPATSLEDLLELAATAPVDEIEYVLVGEAFSRLDQTAQR